MTFRKIVGFLLLAHKCALAAPPAQPAILAQYEKARVAARLRFLPGIFSIRSPDFQAFTRRGERVDLSAEKSRYLALFVDAVRVRLTHQCNNFRSEPAGVRCQAEHTLYVERFDPARKELFTLRARMLSEDHWVETRVGWRMRNCIIQRQGLEHGGPLESSLANQNLLGRPYR